MAAGAASFFSSTLGVFVDGVGFEKENFRPEPVLVGAAGAAGAPRLNERGVLAASAGLGAKPKGLSTGLLGTGVVVEGATKASTTV